MTADKVPDPPPVRDDPTLGEYFGKEPVDVQIERLERELGIGE